MSLVFVVLKLLCFYPVIFVWYNGFSDNSPDERKRRKSFAYGERWIITNEGLKVFLYVRHHFDLSHGFEVFGVVSCLVF